MVTRNTKKAGEKRVKFLYGDDGVEDDEDEPLNKKQKRAKSSGSKAPGKKGLRGKK